MDKPPRLFIYEGIFSEHRSVDLTLKIVSTLLTFFVFIICIAWQMTKRLKSFTNLCEQGTFDLSHRWKSGSICPVVTSTLESHSILCIEDWKLIILHEHNRVLDYYYSRVPKKLRRKWYGVMLSDNTLSNRSKIRNIVMFAFDTLPISIYNCVGYLGADPNSHGAQFLKMNEMSEDRLHFWICSLLCELLFFGPGENVSRSFTSSSKKIFAVQFKNLISSLHSLHVNGNISSNSSKVFNLINYFKPSPIVPNILYDIDRLLNPLVCYYLENFMNNELSNSNEPTLFDCQNKTYGNNIAKSPINLMIQLIRAHHALKEVGDLTEFLTLKHIMHILIEVSLIAQFSIYKTLRAIFAILALRPNWQTRIRNECKKVLVNNSNSKPHPPESYLSLENINCLVWTKALVNEAMRLCIPGWPFGCLRQALKDGQICEYQFRENDLILFNRPAYHYDSELWTMNSQPPTTTTTTTTGNAQNTNMFDPTRFMINHSELDLGNPELNLPVHWVRTILKGYTVCIPNEFIYLLLTSMLMHLIGSGWKICSGEKLSSTQLLDTDLDKPIKWSPNHYLSPIILKFEKE